MTAKEYLEFLASSLVNNPNEVSVSGVLDEKGLLLKLEVSADDMGIIIGRQGKTIDSIRTLLHIYAAKTDSKIYVKLLEK